MEAFVWDAPCLYFATNDDGIIEEVNDTLCHQLGYTAAEIVGQKQDLFFTLPTRIFQQTHFFPLLKMQGHAEEIYITLQTKTGEWLPVLINATRRKRGEQEQTLYAGIVVHNRKKFEDELVAARKAAEAALNENTALVKAKQELQEHAELLDRQMVLVNKQNEELRQFNHVVTHDMQEPLRKLFLFSNMLLDQNSPETNTKTVRKIRAVAEQMRNIISGLQQYVWLIETPVTYVTFELNTLVTSLARELQNEHPIVSVRVLATELPQLTADKAQIKLLLKEIMNNAIRFRKDPLAVTIRISASVVQENTFRSLGDRYQYTDFLRIECRDDGMGFDGSYHQQVFELFKRMHSASGRGVGLALCRKIVQKHQGSITIDSRMGEGTTLTILLPLYPKIPAKPATGA